MERADRVFVRRRDVGRPALVLEERVLGAYAGIVEPRRDALGGFHLSVAVLQEVRHHPVEDSLATLDQGGCASTPARPARLDPIELDAAVLHEGMKGPHGVATTAHACDEGVR